MKTNYILYLLFLCFGSAKAQSFEIIQTDTFNKIDSRNQKQGKWVIRGKHELKKREAGYQHEQKIEEGVYLNNRKEGIWIEYYKNGKERSKLTYVNGVLEGDAIFYSSDGKILKEGKFKGNKWVK